MSLSRRCSKTTCSHRAIATLTYVYSDRTAVLGPLATYAEPHTYDLCSDHTQALSVPRGWTVMRLSMDAEPAVRSEDDLLALADAVREAGRPRPVPQPAPRAPDPGPRLRLIPGENER